MFYADGQTGGRADRQTIAVYFRNCANASKTVWIM